MNVKSPVDEPTSPTGSLGTKGEARRRIRPRLPSVRAARKTLTAERDGTDRDLLVDIAFVLALNLLALIGYRSTFDGYGAQTVGMIGAFGAIAAVVLATRLRLGPLATLGVSVAALVLFAGPAFPDEAIAKVFPGPGTPAALLDGTVTAWKDLLTTAPPLGLGSGLGAVPYVTSFVAALVAGLVALRSTQTLLPSASLVVAVGVSIVLGSEEPVSVLLQGAAVVIAALAWAAIRGNRTRRSADGSIYLPRILGGAAMLVAVAAGGLLVGSSLPMVPESRYIARDDVVPPFDPRDYPSPLAAFRRYRLEQRDDVLFTVDGLPAESRIRLATMDSYDGIVWLVSGSDVSGSGRFERVGTKILPTPEGDTAKIDVTIGAYGDVWMPTLGTMRSAIFEGDAEALQESFRYNRATGTAATPVGLGKSDRYDLEVVLTDPVGEEAGAAAAVDSVALPALPAGANVEAAMALIEERAIDIAGEAKTPYRQAKMLEEHFQEMAFSDGGPKATGRAKVNSGHSLLSIGKFLGEDPNGQLVGNGEHYAATMALMARKLGLPARVVVGFAPEGAGKVEVHGSDADAWVEVAFSGQGWVPFYPTPPEDNVPDEKEIVYKVVDELTTQEPQQDPYLEPPDEAQELERDADEPEEEVERAEALSLSLPGPLKTILRYAGPPILLFALFAAAVTGLKALRRKRRRTNGTLVDRASGAWKELTDLLLDRKLASDGRTRVELATSLTDHWRSGRDAADRFDAAMFGSSDLTEADVDDLWNRAATERSAISEGADRRTRLRAALSTASLRRSAFAPRKRS